MSRALIGQCPGCGAEVPFRSGDSVLAVCAYCSTTCVRAGDALRSMGKMASLFDDHSPLTLGANGAWRDRPFALVGRLQYRYSQGTWNEWRILFEDGSPGWLSDDNGSYVITLDQGEVTVPSFDAIQIGDSFRFGSVDYTVSYREMAVVIAGAGELPFVVGSGYEAPVVDLRGSGGQIATLDFSDLVLADGADATSAQSVSRAVSPRLYAGEAVRLDSLGMQGLLESSDRIIDVKPFSCPNCGSTVSPQFSASRTISCPSCSSVMDLSEGVGSDIAFYQQSAPPAVILPIGSKGLLGQLEWVVVGYQRREGRADGEFFGWDEFLLHNTKQGFRFLNCDSGHWTVGRILQRAIATAVDKNGRGVLRYKGKEFNQFSEYTCHTHYVMGEFFWRVRKDDEMFVIDYISPPDVLSRERSDKEVTWSVSEHIDRAQIATAFGVAPDSLPVNAGVGMVGPAPASRRRSFLAMTIGSVVLLVLTHLIVAWLGLNNKLVPERGLPLNSGVDSHWVTLAGSRPSNVVLSFKSSVNQDYVGLIASLEPEDKSQRVREISEAVSYYSGVQGGESWSEGNRSPRVVFWNVAPGRYRVVISGDHDGPRSAPAVRYEVSQQGKPNLWPLMAGLGLLLAIGLKGIFGERNPESLRWHNSQYGVRPGRRVWASDDDDD